MSKERRQGTQRGRASQAVPSRTSQGRALKIPLLIVCEGEKTERNYLEQLKGEDAVKARFAIRVQSADGKSRQHIVQFAVDRKNNFNEQFDEVWCVMDVEKVEGNPEHRTELHKAIKLAQDNGIVLYLSNPAFEVWILAHFERTCRSFLNCSAVVTELNKHWRNRWEQDYVKNYKGIYERLSPNTGTALRNARAVREDDHRGEPDIVKCNSSTDFYKVVKRLLSPATA